MKALPPDNNDNNDIESLLEWERHASAPPVEAQVRVRTRVEATLGLAAAVAVTAGATQAATNGATQATMTGATQALATAATKALILKLMIGVVGTALVGGGVFAALQHKSPARAIVEEPRAPMVEPRAPVAREPRLVIPAAAPLPRVVHVRKGLADEQAFLEEARAALVGGSPERALRLLQQHQRDFPAAQLGDARDSLVIQALVAEGRVEQARVKAAEFRRRHPHSLFLPAVDASLSR
jgi:hypothetical protein